jgi:ABC-type transport system substrate-binding protein
MPGVFAGMAGLVPSPAAVAADPENYGLDTAVGAGAYAVDSFAPKELLQLTSWDGYWDADNRMFAGINLHTVQSDQVTPGLVSQGQLDIGFAKDGQFEQLASTPGIEYEVSPTGQFTEIFVNYGVAPWDDVRVRQALEFAIDRDLLAEAMTGDTAEPASQPLPPSSWAHNPDVEGKYPYDPEQAKALLAEAGFPDGLSVDIGMIDYDYYRPLAEAVQDMLKDSGFDVTLVPIPPAGVQQALYQDQTVSAAVSAFAPPSAVDPGQTLQQKFGTNGAFNPSHVTIEGLDEALAEGAATTDQAARAEAYQRVTEIAMDQALSIPLYYNAGITMYGPRVHNVTVGEQPSRAANWTSEPHVFLAEG